MELVLELQLGRDLLDGHDRAAEQFLGAINAHLDVILVWRNADVLAEDATKLRFAQVAPRRQALDPGRLLVAAAENLLGLFDHRGMTTAIGANALGGQRHAENLQYAGRQRLLYAGIFLGHRFEQRIADPLNDAALQRPHHGSRRRNNLPFHEPIYHFTDEAHPVFVPTDSGRRPVAVPIAWERHDDGAGRNVVLAAGGRFEMSFAYRNVEKLVFRKPALLGPRELIQVGMHAGGIRIAGPDRHRADSGDIEPPQFVVRADVQVAKVIFSRI